MKRTIFFIILLLIPSLVCAQTPLLAWDQDAPSLEDAQTYTYKYYADGSTTGVILGSISCTGTISPFICSAPLPAFSLGNHRITLTASNLYGESAQSLPLDFAFGVSSTPRNLRIISGG